MKIAFAGAGMVSELYQRAAGFVREVELVAVFDALPAVTQSRSQEWGVRGYSSLDELLDDAEVEAVVVLTPLESHVETAAACLHASRHVLVEKPVAVDPAAIHELAQLAGERGLIAVPAHNYAYTPEFRRALRLVRDGSLGDVRSVFVTYAISHSEEVARNYPGVLASIMIHNTYLALALVGAPDRICAGVAEPAWTNHKVEDQAWMTWEYPRGLSAHLFASFAVGDDSADPWSFVVKVLGTDGSAGLSFRTSIFRRALGTLSVALPVYEETYEHELRAFAAACRDGTPVVSTLEDAETACRIVTAGYASASEGRRLDRLDEAGRPRW